MNIVTDSQVFIRWYENAPLRSGTKNNYKKFLSRLGKFLMNQGQESFDFEKFIYYREQAEWGPIDTRFLDEYLEYLYGKGAKEQELSNTVYALKSITGYLYDAGIISINPFKHYRKRISVPTDPVRDRSLSKIQALKLLIAARRSDNDFRIHFVMVWMMLLCGLRASEMVHLKLNQIDFELGVIRVESHTKSVPMSVTMTEPFTQELKKYIQHPSFWAWQQKGNSELFFVDNRPMNTNDLRKMISNLAVKAKIDKKVTPHDLRHTMAELMLEGGIDLATIQRQLRHRHLKTTLVYLSSGKDLLPLLDQFSNMIFG